MRNLPYQKSLHLLHVPSLFDTCSAYFLSFMGMLCIYRTYRLPAGAWSIVLAPTDCNSTEKCACVYVCTHIVVQVCFLMQQEENVDEYG